MNLSELLASEDDQSYEITKLITTVEDIKTYHFGHDFNLFSVLMRNWATVSNDADAELLVRVIGDNVIPTFNRLYSILSDSSKSSYHHVCQKIICYYLDKCKLSDTDIDILIRSTLQLVDHNQILKCMIIHLNGRHLSYNLLKSKILLDTANTIVYNSVVAVNYVDIMRYLDASFFKLVFMLIEHSFTDFEDAFIALINEHKKFLGEYYKTSILLPCQILTRIADIEGLTRCREYIFSHVDDSRIGLSIVSTLRKTEEFDSLLDNDSFDESNKLRVALSNLDFVSLRNELLIRNAFFGRVDYKSCSIFEWILTKEDLKYGQLNQIWTIFDLFGIPELFTKVCI